MSIGTPQFEEFTGFTPYSTVGPYRAADYHQLDEDASHELIRGRLVMSPCPTPLHQIISGLLFEALSKAAGATNGVAMYAPMDVCFSDDTILQPDLLFVSKTRRHIITHHVEAAPDLVIEILLPATGRRDRTEKLNLYAKHDVPEYWIVDPATKFIEFLILQHGKYTIEQQPDDRYQSPRLSEIEIDLAAFWAAVERRLPKQKPSS